MTIALVDWHCRRGHIERQRADALYVGCKTCATDPGYRGTLEMRRIDLFPHWARQAVSA